MGNIYLWPGFFWTLLNIAIFLRSKIQHSTSAGFNVQQSSKITSFTDLVEERGEKLWKPPFVGISNVFHLKCSWTWKNGCSSSSRMGPLPREVPMCWFRWVLGQKVGQKVQIGIQVGDGQVQCWAWQANILTPIPTTPSFHLNPREKEIRRSLGGKSWRLCTFISDHCCHQDQNLKSPEV